MLPQATLRWVYMSDLGWRALRYLPTPPQHSRDVGGVRGVAIPSRDARELVQGALSDFAVRALRHPGQDFGVRVDL